MTSSETRRSSADQASWLSRKHRRRWLIVRLGCVAFTLVALTIVTPLWLKWRAKQALASRDYDRAEWSLKRLEGWFGADGESSFLRARLCRKRGDWNGVHDSLIQARDRGYPVARLEREQWLTLAQSGQLRAAEPYLNRLLNNPGDDGAEICEAYVNAYFLNHRMVEALRVLDAWIAEFPNDGEPRWIRGKIRVEQQFLKDAEADLRAAWTLDPRSTAIPLDLADLLILERQVEEAAQIYRQIASRRDHLVRARVGEVQALRLLNQPDAARAAAAAILKSEPGNREALLELGLADLESNRAGDAVPVLAQALDLNPRSLVVRQALANALRATGNAAGAAGHAAYVAEAQAALQKAEQLATRVTQFPGDANTRYEIGAIYLKYAVPERGIQWLRSALDCDPNHTAARQALADYAAQQQKPVTGVVPLKETVTHQDTNAKSQPRLRTDHSTRIRFHEHTPEIVAAFAYRNGEEAERSTILEGMGGGAAVFDFDLDDRLDLLFPGGGHFSGEKSLSPYPPGLFRNQGDWAFTRCDVDAGMSSPRYYSHGTAIGDYDNDGFQDVLITGYGGLQLLHNQGDGTFADVTDTATLDDRLWSTSAAWGDLDGDGNLDLYVCHYVNWSFGNDPYCSTVDEKRRERCPPQRYGPLPDSLYRSRGDGTFSNASEESGLRPDGKGLGVVLADVDLDGDLDAYVANDTVGNFLYQNDGRGYFQEIAIAAGVAFNDVGAPDGSMGVAVADYNLDALPDLWVVNYERETIGLYKNLGHCAFEHVSQRTGVSVVGRMYVGFGTVFLDADRDGDEDAFVANGHVLRFPNNAPLRQHPLLFENLAGQRLVDVASQAGDYGRSSHIGRGVAQGDVDGDGDMDLTISHLNDPVALLENTTESAGSWLKVRLIGIKSNRDAIGTRLTLRTNMGIQVRQISSGDSYMSHSDRIVFFGIPDGDEIDTLTIDWPNGKRQSLSHPARNQSLLVHEPK